MKTNPWLGVCLGGGNFVDKFDEQKLIKNSSI